jgi:hypothetical protein
MIIDPMRICISVYHRILEESGNFPSVPGFRAAAKHPDLVSS